MALMTGMFLMTAFLLGPRYGIVAQMVRRRDQIAANATRTLTVHLFNHEGETSEDEENVAAALHQHLHWNKARANTVLLRALDKGLVVQAARQAGFDAQRPRNRTRDPGALGRKRTGAP